jgi:hypothetical protein
VSLKGVMGFFQLDTHKVKLILAVFPKLLKCEKKLPTHTDQTLTSQDRLINNECQNYYFNTSAPENPPYMGTLLSGLKYI